MVRVANMSMIECNRLMLDPSLASHDCDCIYYSPEVVALLESVSILHAGSRGSERSSAPEQQKADGVNPSPFLLPSSPLSHAITSGDSESVFIQ